MTILFVIYNANSFIMGFFQSNFFSRDATLIQENVLHKAFVTILFYAPYESKLFHSFEKERIPVKGCNMPLKDIPEFIAVIGECIIMTY